MNIFCWFDVSLKKKMLNRKIYSDIKGFVYSHEKTNPTYI